MKRICYNTSCSAGVAHPVERHLAKVEVASSSLVTRSKKKADAVHLLSFFENGGRGSKKPDATVQGTVAATSANTGERGKAVPVAEKATRVSDRGRQMRKALYRQRRCRAPQQGLHLCCQMQKCKRASSPVRHNTAINGQSVFIARHRSPAALRSC